MDKNSSLLISYFFYWFDSYKDRCFLHSLRQFEMHPLKTKKQNSSKKVLPLQKSKISFSEVIIAKNHYEQE